MKKTIASFMLVASIAVSSNLYAQEKTEATTTKTSSEDFGKIFVGGNINAILIKNTDDGSDHTKYNLFGSEVKVGYFVAKDCAVGLKLGYDYSKVEDGNTTKFNMVNVGIFMRYDKLWNNAAGFYIEPDLSAGFGKIKDELNGTTFEMDVNAIEVGISPGAVIRLSKKMSLDIGIGRFGYGSYKQKHDNYESTTNTLILSFNNKGTNVSTNTEDLYFLIFNPGLNLGFTWRF